MLVLLQTQERAQKETSLAQAKQAWLTCLTHGLMVLLLVPSHPELKKLGQMLDTCDPLQINQASSRM